MTFFFFNLLFFCIITEFRTFHSLADCGPLEVGGAPTSPGSGMCVPCSLGSFSFPGVSETSLPWESNSETTIPRRLEGRCFQLPSMPRGSRLCSGSPSCCGKTVEWERGCLARRWRGVEQWVSSVPPGAGSRYWLMAVYPP